MSRSYKKPYVKDKSNKKDGKKAANNKVKRTKEIGNGKQYKKVYNSWNICDYKFRIDEDPKFKRK